MLLFGGSASPFSVFLAGFVRSKMVKVGFQPKLELWTLYDVIEMPVHFFFKQSFGVFPVNLTMSSCKKLFCLIKIAADPIRPPANVADAMSSSK